MAKLQRSVAVPLGMAVDSRVRELADGLGVACFHAAGFVTRMFLFCAEQGNEGNISGERDAAINELAGAAMYPNFVAHFKRLFVRDGVFEWYVELNRGKSRSRELAAERMRRLRKRRAVDKDIQSLLAGASAAKRGVPLPALELTPEPILVTKFAEAWEAYPKRKGGNPRKLALGAWNARLREGVSDDDLLMATQNYAAFVRSEGKENTSYVLLAATFYGPNARYADFLKPITQPIDDFDDVLAEVGRAHDA